MQPFILLLLFLLALMLIFIVCKKKGLLSVLSLVLTILILLFVSIPLITKGYDPILVAGASGFCIVFLIIYLTEGFNIISHIAIFSTLVAFTLTGFLAWASIVFIGLNGLVSEESSYAVQYGLPASSLPKLLVAGIMIGTLGILAEMVVTQVAVCAELISSDPLQKKAIIFKKAYDLGVTHLGSMVNTLFLIYAGVSLPLLIVIIAGQATLTNILHSQALVLDIVSTLAGVIGLVVSMPIATWLAVYFLKRSKSG